MQFSSSTFTPGCFSWSHDSTPQVLRLWAPGWGSLGVSHKWKALITWQKMGNWLKTLMWKHPRVEWDVAQLNSGRGGGGVDMATNATWKPYLESTGCASLWSSVGIQRLPKRPSEPRGAKKNPEHLRLYLKVMPPWRSRPHEGHDPEPTRPSAPSLLSVVHPQSFALQGETCFNNSKKSIDSLESGSIKGNRKVFNLDLKDPECLKGPWMSQRTLKVSRDPESLKGTLKFSRGPDGLQGALKVSNEPDGLQGALKVSRGPDGLQGALKVSRGPDGLQGALMVSMGPEGFKGPWWSPRSPEGLKPTWWSPRSPEGLKGPWWSPRSPDGLQGALMVSMGPEGLKGPWWSPRSPAGLNGPWWSQGALKVSMDPDGLKEPWWSQWTLMVSRGPEGLNGPSWSQGALTVSMDPDGLKGPWRSQMSPADLKGALKVSAVFGDFCSRYVEH